MSSSMAFDLSSFWIGWTVHKGIEKRPTGRLNVYRSHNIDINYSVLQRQFLGFDN